MQRINLEELSPEKGKTQLQEMETCSVCGRIKKVIHHHLNYEPEIIIKTCHGCHFVMHKLAGISRDQQDIIFNYVRQYGSFWEDGREKCSKSEHRRKSRNEYQKQRNKTEKVKEYHKEYNKTNNVKKYQKQYQKGNKRKEYEKQYYLKKNKEEIKE